VTALINTLLLALALAGASMERVAPIHAAPAQAMQQEMDMRQGRTIEELAQEIVRQEAAKKDFVGDTRNMKMRVREVGEANDLDDLLAKPMASRAVKEGEKGNELVLGWGNGEKHEMPLIDIAHGQIRDRLKIPAKYYARLLQDHPDLLATNVNALLEREPEKRMLRTLDGTLRGYMSDKFRIFDHAPMFEAIFPALQRLGVKVVSAEVTDRRLYLKFLAPAIKIDAPDLMPPNVKIDPHGDAMTPGAVIRSGEFAGYKASEIVAGGVISNSENGFGRMRVDRLQFFLRCLNGWIDATVMARTHVGRSTAAEGIDCSEFFTDETRLLDDAAVFSKLRDTVNGMFTMESLQGWVDTARAAKADKIEDPRMVTEVVEVVGNRLALNEGQRRGVLASLIEDGDLSRWGVSNAITAMSQTVEDYDAATDLEAEGGKVVRMKKTDWTGILAEAKRLAA